MSLDTTDPITATETRRYGHFINGVALEPATETIKRDNPADGTPLATFAAGTQSDAAAAIAVARTAFDSGSWPRTPAMDRARVLLRAAGLIRRDGTRLAEMEALETGKPLVYAEGDIATSAELFEYAAGLAMTAHGESHTSIAENCTALVVREPAGVVGMIVPWNFPLLLLAQKLPFALAAGCTTVIKPSEFTSSTALEVAALLTEAGLPDGVVNVVTGFGQDVGAPLSASKDVDVLSFTGSTATGRAISAAAAGTVKRLSMELGGKAASIVFDDADLDDALDGVLFGVFYNNGECCVSGARLLVQESVADDFVARVKAAAERVRVGSPLDPETEVGPMINGAHLDKVLGHIDAARASGANVIVGGNRSTEDGHAAGYFVQPTIIDEVGMDSNAFQEEIFGPVLTITRFTDADDAVRLTNATEYGLASSIWSKNIDRALSVAKRIRIGRVWVNTSIDGAPQLPAGGMKQSGFGREMGVAGYEEFTEVKTIQIREGKRTPAFPRWTLGI